MGRGRERGRLEGAVVDGGGEGGGVAGGVALGGVEEAAVAVVEAGAAGARRGQRHALHQPPSVWDQAR